MRLCPPTTWFSLTKASKNLRVTHSNMLSNVVFARSFEGAARYNAWISGYSNSMTCLHMSGEIGTQSKALHAFLALEGLCVRFKMLASVVLVTTGRGSTDELTCSDLRYQNVWSIHCNRKPRSSPWCVLCRSVTLCKEQTAQLYRRTHQDISQW